MGDIVTLVKEVTQRVMVLAWALFMLSWSLGWAIKGSPIPFLKLKRAGQDLIEDAIWAAFWLAMGTTVFAIIVYIASALYMPPPPPPSI